MSKVKEEISEIIRDFFNYEAVEVVEKGSTIYVMVEVKSEEKTAVKQGEIEKKILSDLGITTKICFIQSNQMKKNIKVKKKIPWVKKVILICSGKGGVGKSTISANIAYHLALAGHKVGLFDSDIYGPSIQKIFGVDKEIEIKDNTFIPHEKDGVKIMSMGFVVKSDEALVWRGPMVSKTLHNLLMHTDWSHKNIVGMKSDLDYLIIDSPPGTGDVHLSLAENYFIDGAVVVSTPQELAISNAHRSVDMLKKLGIKIFGIAENMAYFVNPDGTKNYLFGKGNVEKYTIKHNLSLLATIPIIPEISRASGGIGSCEAANKDFKVLCEILKRLAS